MTARPRRGWLARAGLALWFPAVLSVGVYLLAGHVRPLPDRADHERLRSAIVGSDPRPGIRVVHFLYGDCKCSAAVRERLIARGPRTDVQERVVVIDGRSGDAESLRKASFVVDEDTVAEAAERWSIEATPLLAVVDANGALAYEGGYTRAKPSPIVRDGEIVDAVARGERVEPLPVFGCAVSARMKKETDPLGLRVAGAE